MRTIKNTSRLFKKKKSYISPLDDIIKSILFSQALN